MAFIHEYSCGCYQHSLAGFIRRCNGQISRSLTGRQVSNKQDNGESKHNSAMGIAPVKTYKVADILP